MRLSELFDTPVSDRDGRHVGGVADVVLVQDGPMVAEHAASYRVAGLIVVERRHARLLGYEREVRPVLFRSIVRWHAGDVLHVPWEAVDEVTSTEVTLRVSRDELDRHERAARR